MSDRDELAHLILSELKKDGPDDWHAPLVVECGGLDDVLIDGYVDLVKLSDALLAAGFRKGRMEPPPCTCWRTGHPIYPIQWNAACPQHRVTTGTLTTYLSDSSKGAP